jgi:hypothetical protein
VKIDVDGGECDILDGASALLQAARVRWLVETHSVALEERCATMLRNAGYRVRIVPNAAWRLFLPEQRPIEQNRWLVAARPGDVSI